MVRVDIMINGDRVDALALIVHKDNAPYRGRELVEKMRELIPRQQFDIAIQAAIGNQMCIRDSHFFNCLIGHVSLFGRRAETRRE